MTSNIKTILNYGVSHGYIEKNPVAGYKPLKVIKTSDEVKYWTPREFKLQYKEIVYYKGTNGYGWYASRKEGGAYLGKKANLTILRAAYPKARFRDPHGHIEINEVYR